MPTYVIEQYQVYTQRFLVEAEDRARAVKKFLIQSGEEVENSLELVHADWDLDMGMLLDDGIQMDEDAKFADELRKLGVRLDDGRLLGIASVEEAKVEE